VSTFFDESSNSSIFFLPKTKKTKQTEAADRHADEQRAAIILVGRIDDILSSGIDVNVTDERGETALSYVKILLRKGCFRLAHQIASHLLDHGALVDAEDNGQQTLLSHSVAALDGASDLTRMLLNRGADVWHRNGTGGDSPFGSFLQAIVRCRCVSGATITADLLGRTMGSRPEAFKALVLRSMLRHGRFIRVLGPVFVQLKSILSPYWRQPQPLRYAAWTVIRRHSSPVKSWARELQQMGLPPSVLRYLTMED
jgi:ankyrin repeat protein